MITEYRFLSKSFSPTAGELDDTHADFINPGVFARELAEFLTLGLAEEGYVVKERVVEDWGNWLELEHDGKFPLAICCSNIEDRGQGVTEHRIATEPSQPYVRRLLRKIDVRVEVERLSAALARILNASARVMNVEAS